VPFDIDRLRERLTEANAMRRGWRRIIELNRGTPALFNALTDGTVYLGVANCLRATPEGAAYFADLVEEMEYRRAEGIGVLADERHRLIFVGVPCYPIFRRFGEMFSEWGGVFVNSTYMHFASGGANSGLPYDLADPLGSLADGLLTQTRAAMDSMFFQTEALLEMVDRFAADGIVYHPIKSCRTVSTGLADNRRAVMERRDIPSLYIESDMMDRRVVSEAQLKNRIDAFFEGLAARRTAAGRDLNGAD
jgi:benzoyl-CoA reductase subunit B